MTFSKMKLKDLKELVLSCHDAIYNTECYGTRDSQNLHNGMAELRKRGYAVKEIETLSIYKIK